VAFADRTARELLATGEKPRRRIAETRDQLTAQEEQVAQLAADGLSNPEIGAQLFISPRTVEYHLHKVYGKLGVKRRSQVARASPDPGAPRGRADATGCHLAPTDGTRSSVRFRVSFLGLELASNP
jgi:DNA-binding CsgD family transcriptional regulator